MEYKAGERGGWVSVGRRKRYSAILVIRAHNIAWFAVTWRNKASMFKFGDLEGAGGAVVFGVNRPRYLQEKCCDW